MVELLPRPLCLRQRCRQRGNLLLRSVAIDLKLMAAWRRIALAACRQSILSSRSCGGGDSCKPLVG